MVSIIASDPRFIIVRVSSLHVNFYVISAHAPYVGCRVSDICEWWPAFSKVIAKSCVSGIAIVCGIDGNIGTYPCASSLIGGYGLISRGGLPAGMGHDKQTCSAKNSAVPPEATTIFSNASTVMA